MKIKDKIKKLAKRQVYLKNQRKKVNLIGERTMRPWDAYLEHQSNRWNLMHLYMAYSMLRNKEVQYPTNKEYSMSKVEDIVSEYKSKFQKIN